MGLFNLALYQEMSDDIDQAISTLDQAIQEATKTNRRGKTSPFIDTTYLSQYHDVLVFRKSELEKLERLKEER